MAGEHTFAQNANDSDMLQKVSLSNFRNFKSKEFCFFPRTTIIIGPNTSGKTNILEALALLSTGKSFKARIEEEMIRHGEAIARAKGLVEKSSLEVVLTRGEIRVSSKVEKVARKRLFINKVGKRLIDFAGNFKMVLFGPWDMKLVTESPSLRRAFLDSVLSQVDREYRRALLSYEKGLRQRNKLLFRIREGPPAGAAGSRSQLLFWNQLLIKNGDYISRKREEFIGFINKTDPLNKQVFVLQYDKNAISENRLEQYGQEEIAAATTLVGPHRDDIIFKIKSQSRRSGTKSKIARNLARYGSRGEQRMSVLWLKLAELAFIEKETEERPTLLLDDVLSELDREHRRIVVQMVKGGQTIITTVDSHFLENSKKDEIIKL